MNFEQSPKFAVAAETPSPSLGYLSQTFQSPYSECDDRFHDHRLGRFQAVAHDPIRTTGTWSSARVGTEAVISLWKLHGRDSRRALRGRLVEILSQYFTAPGKHVNGVRFQTEYDFQGFRCRFAPGYYRAPFQGWKRQVG